MTALAIHNIRKEFFDLDLSAYELTFDDGLYSHYYYASLFQKIKSPRTYFITTGFIRPGKARKVFDGDYLPYVKSKKYMYRAFIEKNPDQFMTLDEVKALAQQEGAIIGAHSHYHDVILTNHPLKKPLSPWKLQRLPHAMPKADGTHMNRRSALAFQGYQCIDGRLETRPKTEWLDFIKHDAESCLTWFEKNLGFQPDTYAFPFNEQSPELVSILKTFGFTRFYNGRSGDNVTIFNRKDIDAMVADE